MSASPQRQESADPSPPAAPRPSLLRRLFGWLWPRGDQRRSSHATDAYFAGVGSSPGAVLGPKRSSHPPSPLAAAYAARRTLPPVESPAEPPSAPQWKVLDPPESCDPTRHREWRLARVGDAWTLLGASVRGRLHAHQALWRDDSFAWNTVEEWTCVAVGDGAGSASLSRVGSRIACDEGVRALSAALTGWKPPAEEDGTPSQDGLRRFRKLLAGAAQQARAAIIAEAVRRGQPLRDFHTTCLLLAHRPFGDGDLVAALQVGDGCVGLYTGPHACRVLGDADHGTFASETRFLTTPGIEDDLERRIVFAFMRDLRAVALMTDGVSDDFHPESRRLVELFEGNPIADLKTADGGPVRGVLHGVAADPRDGEALAAWLQYEKRGSSDDRTLVVLLRTETPDRSAV
jgi:hypothetical protein